MRRRLRLLALGVLVAVLLALCGVLETGDGAIRVQLEAIGDSIYEYHRQTGQWPAGVADLEKTMLPQRLPHAVPSIKQGLVTVTWRGDLKPDPAANADRILAYHSGGWLPKLGWVVICWGDLRTEWMKLDEVEAKLQADKN